VQLAGDQNIQVARHRRRDREADFFADRTDYFGVVNLLLRFDRHIGHGQPVLWNNCRELKARTKTRFTHAPKEATRVGGLELRAERYLLRAAPLFLIAHVKKSAALLIDLARKSER